ncbi:FxSxx-COOH system tetratricopeptide repeat protein [Spirillospora sp. CA-294931]|uniref:FxSxx-COOH system tetratricopeptide repeat protein n=1 Tax=Spirillospora sp. CA-294931 TaxID=3240042 RepID=UPI003D915AC7
MTEGSGGRIVTFYSYKGGTGRTMALANVAWILAANGKRVLVADWDLESPGLHKFFAPFIDVDVRDARGVIDLIRGYRRDYDRLADDPVGPDGNPDQLRALINDSVKVQRHAFSLNWTSFPEGATLDFLPAGKQNTEYAAVLNAVDWEAFYNRQEGSDFLDALRADMKRCYDYVLIDSRTGLGDVADICTKQLPDVLVDCFTLSNQGIEGAANIATSIQTRYGRHRGIRVLPVPMRVDPGEKERADRGHQYAVRKFAGLPSGMDDTERRDYWTDVEVPYVAYYSYEEILATFGDPVGSPKNLLGAYERLTGHITDGQIAKCPAMNEDLRTGTVKLFTRQRPSDTPNIVLDHAAEDGAWGDWLREVLTSAGVKVLDPGEVLGTRAADDLEPRVLRLVASLGDKAPGPAQPHYIVYVNGVSPVNEYSGARSVDLSDDAEGQAIDRLLQMLGLVYRRRGQTSVRYPALEPRIARTLPRNARFTGREEDLGRLRRQLRERGRAVVVPVTLQGLGGVGKTQVALEYVHRYKTDYDVVWWIDCGQPQFVDSALADLGREIESRFEQIAPAGSTDREMAALVLQALSRNEPVERWLIVFDNAEDVEELKRFVPSGRGHVLITSRNRAWEKQGDTLPVDVFTRAESVTHLAGRVRGITSAEAQQVAESLGDLPLAVAAAGAWLAETGRSVADYLEELRKPGPAPLAANQLKDYSEPVARAWDLSLKQLGKRSPAAVRLFELCSLLAPDISLEIFSERTMVELLSPFDPALQPPMVIDRLVRELNRLALVKHDTSGRRIQVHRLVQVVVRSGMTPERLEETRRDVHRVLAAARPKDSIEDPKNWPGFRRLWPHLDPSEAEGSPDEAVRDLLLDRLRYLFLGADSERGLELGERVQRRWQEMLDDFDARKTALPKQLLHLQFNLANVMRQLDRYTEALALDEEVLEGQTRLLGEDHPHRLMTASSLAASLRALGRYREALEMDDRTYTTWRELYGEDNIRTLSAANNLATCYRIVGQHTRAFEIDQATLKRRTATQGAEHPRTMDSNCSLARDLLELGRYEEAVTRMQAVWKTCIKTEGIDSRRALNAQVLLGVAQRSAGKSKDAERNFLAAHEGLIRRFGPEHSDSLACRVSNASNLLVLSRLKDGEREIREVMAVLERRLGSTHAHHLVCGVNLASALRLLSNPKEARAVVEHARAGLSEALGADHPHTLAAVMVHATIQADLGELDEAEALESDTAARMAKTLGSRHPDTLRCQANHMLTKSAMGDTWAAGARVKVCDQLEELLGSGHPSLETLRANRRVVRAVDPQPY